MAGKGAPRAKDPIPVTLRPREQQNYELLYENRRMQLAQTGGNATRWARSVFRIPITGIGSATKEVRFGCHFMETPYMSVGVDAAGTTEWQAHRLNSTEIVPRYGIPADATLAAGAIVQDWRVTTSGKEIRGAVVRLWAYDFWFAGPHNLVTPDDGSQPYYDTTKQLNPILQINLIFVGVAFKRV